MVASHAPSTGDLAYNSGMCPDWESNWGPFGLQASTESTEPHQPGHKYNSLYSFLTKLHLSISSLNTYIDSVIRYWSSYCVPATVLSVNHPKVNKTGKLWSLLLGNLFFFFFEATTQITK